MEVVRRSPCHALSLWAREVSISEWTLTKERPRGGALLTRRPIPSQEWYIPGQPLLRAGELPLLLQELDYGFLMICCLPWSFPLPFIQGLPLMGCPKFCSTPQTYSKDGSFGLLVSCVSMNYIPPSFLCETVLISMVSAPLFTLILMLTQEVNHSQTVLVLEGAPSFLVCLLVWEH